jgi:hypothetical protein
MPLVAGDHFLLQEAVQSVAQRDDVGRVGVGIGNRAHRVCPSGFTYQVSRTLYRRFTGASALPATE